METTLVESSTLAQIGYDLADQLLLLEFRDQTTCQYFDVPFDVYTELRNAPSKGQFFNRYIRGHFRYSATSQPPALGDGNPHPERP